MAAAERIDGIGQRRSAVGTIGDSHAIGAALAEVAEVAEVAAAARPARTPQGGALRGMPAVHRGPPAGGLAKGRADRRELRWSFLGQVPYREAATLQEELRLALRERARGGLEEAAGAAAATERLLLLEHPHVYTLGRNASAADVLASPEWLARHQIEVVECDRGGQVTYHGPGQLVGYPILDLSPDRRDVRRYVRDLEEVLIRTLADYGIGAEVRPDTALVGVWAGGKKIAAIGVHLSRWITTHGFALNVATDLSLYGGIVACGLRQEGITSMALLLGAAPPLAEVAARLAGHFATVFDRQLVRWG